MIFDVPTLVAHVTSVMTLLPGDVILTGTPEGVGPMQVGDEVEVSIEGIGALTNTVVEAMTEVSTGSTTDASASGSARPRPGRPHVGLARTALFNWAFARHHGGTFVFRIEDTDAARNTQESYDALLEVMRWLGLDWDEGPEVGGPHAPYRQSERGDIYADVLARLREAVAHLRLLLHQRRGRGAPQGVGLQADGVRRLLPRAHRRAGRGVRGRGPRARRRASGCPTARSPSTTWSAARSPSTPSTCPTSRCARANGHPLYTLVNPVDDALMEITHVLRGEDLLSSTPRQIALYDALQRDRRREGDAAVRPPALRDGRGQQEALQARPRGAACSATATQGFLPEGLLNYLALLGWAIAADRDVFSHRRDGRGLRHRRRQPQPGPLRPEEGRGDQRRPHAAAVDRGPDPPRAARSSRRPAWSATR